MLRSRAEPRRFDKHGHPDPSGRYDRSNNFVWTPRERLIALVIAATALLTLLGLPAGGAETLPGKIFATLLGIAAFFGLWVGIIGRHNNDPD